MRRVKETVRWFGPSEVEKLKERKDVEGLIRKLETGKPKEQKTAAYALGEIGDERATEPIIRLLESNVTTGDVCIACVNALGKLGDDRAIETLVRALSDDIRGKSSPIGLLELPVALADSDDVPIILGRVDGIDIFDARFLNGNEVKMSWKDEERKKSNNF